MGLGIVLDIAYVGSLGRNLEQVVNLNAVPYGATFQAYAQDPSKYNNAVPSVQPGLPPAYAAAGLPFNGVNALPQDFLRPYTGYGDISYRNNGASSNYNSLQVSVSRHMSRGLILGAAYTFSKNFVTNNSDSDSVNPFNTRAYEYRLAASDQTHNLVVSYVYDLPRSSSVHRQPLDQPRGFRRVGAFRHQHLPDGNTARTVAVDIRRQRRAGDRGMLYIRAALLRQL